MSYCDFNNAFKNMNDKFLETFDGITSEDLYFDHQNIINSTPAVYAESEQNEQNKINLNGTSIQNLSNSNKLTHRECIYIYLNPNNSNYQIAQKHVANCSLCQNEIKKINDLHQKDISNDLYQKDISNNLKKNNTSLTTQPNQPNHQNQPNQLNHQNQLNQQNQINNRNQINNSNDTTNNNVVCLSINDLEILFKNINEKNKQNDNYEHFNRVINTLENKKYDNSNKPLCIEINFINIAICLLIIFLLIDIILRIKN